MTSYSVLVSTGFHLHRLTRGLACARHAVETRAVPVAIGVPPSFSIADVGFAIPHVINLDFLFSITLDPQAEAAQVEIGSKGAHH